MRRLVHAWCVAMAFAAGCLIVGVGLAEFAIRIGPISLPIIVFGLATAGAIAYVVATRDLY